MNIVPNTSAQDEATLTPEEMRFIRAYRRFDDESQDFWLEALESASQNPKCGLRHQKPELRVVAGGAA